MKMKKTATMWHDIHEADSELEKNQLQDAEFIRRH